MKVCIFTECHKNTGRGHLTRCLALAEEFQKRNIIPLLFVDDSGNEEISKVDKRIISLYWITDFSLFQEKLVDSDIIIVDSYLAPIKYIQLVSEVAKVPVFFDDYSRLLYPKGILINGSPGSDEELYFQRNNGIKLLTGLSYQIVRPEFNKQLISKINPNIQNVFITLGGVINNELLVKIIKTVSEKLSNVNIHAVLGEKTSITVTPNIHIYEKLSAFEMCELMSSCDIAITGAGQTIFELMITGIPFIAIKTAENQKYNVRGLEKFGLAKTISAEDVLFEKELKAAIQQITAQEKRKELVDKYKNTIDGKGASRIVTEIIREGIPEMFRLRKAIEADLMSVFELSNELEVRKNSFVPDKISLQNHKQWFHNIIKEESVLFLIGEISNEFAGQVRYRINKNECTVGISVSPNFRGLSIGEKLLKDSIPILKAQFPEVKLINAWVKPENEGSNKLFLKSGYHLVLEKDPENHDSKKYILEI